MADNRLLSLLKNNFFQTEFVNGLSGKDFTTFGVGGVAEITAFPKTEDELCNLVKYLKTNDVPFITLGKGSNVIFSDNGFSGVIIKTDKMKQIILNRLTLTVGAGVTATELIAYCKKNGLGGLEFLVGIPASVGGMVVGNAGAFGKAIGDNVVSVKVFNSVQNDALKTDFEEIKTVLQKNCNFSYRKSSIEGIILSADVTVEKQLLKESERLLNYYLDRRSNQPKGRTCGSVFKNGNGYFAAELIEKCGMKGKRDGGVCVSNAHANFLINDGSGTAEQAKNLINEIKTQVKNKFGIQLIEEIKYIGDDI